MVVDTIAGEVLGIEVKADFNQTSVTNDIDNIIIGIRSRYETTNHNSYL